MKMFGFARLGICEYDEEEVEGCECWGTGPLEREPKRELRVVLEGWFDGGGAVVLGVVKEGRVEESAAEGGGT